MQALRRVLEVFWAKGHEATQLIDLTAALGITPPSFYAAFVSKEAAFREAVALYKETVGSGFMRALDESGAAAECIRAMLTASVDVAITAPGSAGCLLITGVLNCHPESDPLSDLLKGIRRENIARVAARLERGRDDGDVSADADIPTLARFYSGIMQAISMQARDGMSREELEGLIDPAMTPLDFPPNSLATSR